MIKVSTSQEDIITYMHLATCLQTYMKQKLLELKGEIDNSRIIVGNFRIPH